MQPRTDHPKFDDWRDDKRMNASALLGGTTPGRKTGPGWGDPGRPRSWESSILGGLDPGRPRDGEAPTSPRHPCPPGRFSSIWPCFNMFQLLSGSCPDRILRRSGSESVLLLPQARVQRAEAKDQSMNDVPEMATFLNQLLLNAKYR